MDTFSNIRFKKDTAQRFQTFSRRYFKTHTETLQTMLDFFIYNEISPKESFGPNGRTIANLIKKRFNAMVAMLKNMEKHGVLPTKAMLELLFESSPQKKQGQAPLLMAGKKFDPDRDRFLKKVEEAIAMEKDFTNIKRDFGELRTDFLNLLNRVELVKGSFGRPRLQLDMSQEDFQKLKIKIEKQ
ncbi:BfmA/BtgA family mobilization protein [Arenibacter palladensis]|uniref:BfmA/BtgA family mobilization protein n=1 Tax=Arenibacter palladensis TaxID=237373 RepID=UPI0026E33B98|nr:BfmA/BtgA family mobilization protein [Arenibacter palladensis]MDO6602814.1 BfmA/BtgA family mobilization protein [Arenibacter palladensis]